MTVAYDALIASAAPDFVVLAEIQPMEMLAVWTAAGGGLTNTYYVSFSTQIATTIIAGGIYRRLDFVRQDTTALTSRASAALVDANLGSYFHDTSTNRLYVSTTTGANPDTFALLGAWFTLFFSTRSVDFSDQPVFAPLITGSLPVFRSEIPDILFGAVSSTTGTLSLLNGDGLFDRLSQQYIWRNKSVTFKLGGATLAYSDFALVATLKINHIGVSDEEATVELEQVGNILNAQIPPKVWGDGTVLENDVFDEAVLGNVQPWLFGQTRDCPLVCTNESLERFNVVQIILPSDLFLPTPIRIFAIARSTGVRQTVPASDYSQTGTYFTINLTKWPIRAGTANGYLINNAFYAAGTTTVAVDTGTGNFRVGDIITFNGYDGTHHVTSWTPSTSLSFSPGLAVTVNNDTAVKVIKTAETYDFVADITESQVGITTAYFGYLVKQFLQALGVPEASIDATALANANTSAVLGTYLTEKITAADVLRRFEQSVLGHVVIGPDGKWTGSVFDPSSPASYSVSDADFVSWEPDSQLLPVLSDVRVTYAPLFASQTSSEVSSSSDTARYANETTDSHQIATYIQNETDADALAQRLRFLSRAPGQRIRFEERGLSLMTAQVGQFVAVTRARGPIARTGKLDGQLLRIVRLEKSLGPETPTVRGVFWDCGGNADAFARCEDSAVNRDWSASTDEQKAVYGYCSDTDGYIDAADPLTRTLKVTF